MLTYSMCEEHLAVATQVRIDLHHYKGVIILKSRLCSYSSLLVATLDFESTDILSESLVHMYQN